MDQRAVARGVARCMPAFIFALFAFAAWVETSAAIYMLSQVTGDPGKTHPQVAAAVIILIIFYMLLFCALVTYARLVYVVTLNPGYLPRWNDKTDEGQVINGEKRSPLPFFLTALHYESFVCQSDGWPRYCSNCQIYKGNRDHHCREVDRCVRAMDHFCPWQAVPSCDLVRCLLIVLASGSEAFLANIPSVTSFNSLHTLPCSASILSRLSHTSQRRNREELVNWTKHTSPASSSLAFSHSSQLA